MFFGILWMLTLQPCSPIFRVFSLLHSCIIYRIAILLGCNFGLFLQVLKIQGKNPSKNKLNILILLMCQAIFIRFHILLLKIWLKISNSCQSSSNKRDTELTSLCYVNKTQFIFWFTFWILEIKNLRFWLTWMRKTLRTEYGCSKGISR